MKKKGFTLVELLVAIAILAILVLLVIPNILNLFNKAKERSFINELRDVYRAAQTKYVSETVTGGREREYARVTDDECESTVKLSGREELEFMIKFDAEGKVVMFKATDGSFQYNYEGPGLDVEKITEVVDLSDVSKNQAIHVSCDSGPGAEYYTSSVHQQHGKEIMLGFMKMYPSYKDFTSNTTDRVFLKYKIEDYYPNNVTAYCIKNNAGNDSCNNSYRFFENLDDCNIEVAKENEGTGNSNYYCESRDAKYFEGNIISYSLGYILNNKKYNISVNNFDDYLKAADIIKNSYGEDNCIMFNSSGEAFTYKKSNSIISKLFGIPEVKAYDQEIGYGNTMYCYFGANEALIFDGEIAVKYGNKLCEINTYDQFSGCSIVPAKLYDVNTGEFLNHIK